MLDTGCCGDMPELSSLSGGELKAARAKLEAERERLEAQRCVLERRIAELRAEWRARALCADPLAVADALLRRLGPTLRTEAE